MKTLFSVVIVVAVSLFMPASAAGCSCSSPSDPCAAITAADVVFVGRVRALDPGSDEPSDRRPSMARFEVTEILHGTLPKRWRF